MATSHDAGFCDVKLVNDPSEFASRFESVGGWVRESYAIVQSMNGGIWGTTDGIWDADFGGLMAEFEGLDWENAYDVTNN